CRARIPKQRGLSVYPLHRSNTIGNNSTSERVAHGRAGPLSRLLDRQRKGNMVERRTELKRRYHRKKKLRKLKAKLATAKEGREKEHVLRKIHILSPWWSE